MSNTKNLYRPQGEGFAYGLYTGDLKLYQLDANTLSLENLAGGTYKDLKLGTLYATTGITLSNNQAIKWLRADGDLSAQNIVYLDASNELQIRSPLASLRLNYDISQDIYVWSGSAGTGRIFCIQASLADAGNTLRDSPSLYIRSRYWNGSATTDWNYRVYQAMLTAGATPKSQAIHSINAVNCLVLENNNGAVGAIVPSKLTVGQATLDTGWAMYVAGSVAITNQFRVQNDAFFDTHIDVPSIRNRTDNQATLPINIRVTGTDATDHEVKLQIDSNDLLIARGTGDGAGGITAAKGIIIPNYLAVGQTVLNTSFALAVTGGAYISLGVKVADGYGLYTDNNASNVFINIPVTGTDATTHDINLRIDGNTYLQVRATGDGAGGVTNPVVNLYTNITFGNGKVLQTSNTDDDHILFYARDNGVGRVETARLQSGADPFFSFGGSQQMKFYNSGYADFNGIVYLESQVKLTGNVDVASTVDTVIFATYELSAGNRTLALATETAVATEATTPDSSLTVRINGATYKIPLEAV